MRKWTFLVVATGFAAATVVALASASHTAKQIAPSAEAAWPWEPAGSIPAGTANNNWQEPMGDLGASQFSYLKQINTSNVSGLKVAWQESFDKKDFSGNVEGTPIVVSGKGKNLPLESGTMFVSAFLGMFALDPSTGKILWEYQGPRNANGTWGSRGYSNRTQSYGNGRIYFGQQDGSIVALNAKTGAPLWTHQVAAAGTLYGHLVNIGTPVSFLPGGPNGDGIVTGGPNQGTFAIRGHLDGVNARTGELVWRWFATPDPTELPYILTWGNPAEAAVGAANFWGALGVDPKLGMVYGQTGNVFPEEGRSPGKNLWGASLVAINYKTGSLAWYFQETHHEVWDSDGAMPPVLFNTTINGKSYPAVVGCNKAAFCEVLDRRNGRPLPNFPMKEMPVQPGLAVNNEWPTQPENAGAMRATVARCTTLEQAQAAYSTFPVAPNGTPLVLACEQANSVNTEYRIQPSNSGAVNYARSAYNPITNDWYPCMNNTFQAIENVSPVDWHVNSIGGGILSSLLSAVNMSTNTMDWQRTFAGSQFTGPGSKRSDGVNPGMTNGVWSGGCAVTGVMSTAGNLVFVSSAGNTNCNCVDTSTTAGGVLFAFNAKTGEGPLWSWQAPDGINTNPMTYQVNGKQYVAIYAKGHGPTSPLSDGERDKLTIFSL